MTANRIITRRLASPAPGETAPNRRTGHPKTTAHATATVATSFASEPTPIREISCCDVRPLLVALEDSVGRPGGWSTVAGFGQI